MSDTGKLSILINEARTFGVEVHAVNPNENVETLLIDDQDIVTIEVP